MAVRIENLDGRVGRMETRLNDYAIRQRKVENFVNSYQAVEAERDKKQSERHRENSEKLDQLMLKIGKKSYLATVVGVAAAIAGVAIAILAILVTIRVAKSDLDPLKIITSHPNEPAVSSRQSDLPPTYQSQ